MNRIAVAQELVRIAEMLTAMPMMRVDMGVELRRDITPVLRQVIGLEGNAARANPVFSKLLTNTKGTHNKFHYFAIYQDQSGEFVGGNCAGRIGYPNTYDAVVVGRSSDYQDVERKVTQKMMMKMHDKGYELDRFAA